MASNPEIDLSGMVLTDRQIDDADWLATFMSLFVDGAERLPFRSVLYSLQESMEVLGIDRGEDGSIPASARVAAGLIMNEFDYDVVFPVSVTHLTTYPYCSSAETLRPAGGENGQ